MPYVVQVTDIVHRQFINTAETETEAGSFHSLPSLMN